MIGDPWPYSMMHAPCCCHPPVIVQWGQPNADETLYRKRADRFADMAERALKEVEDLKAEVAKLRSKNHVVEQMRQHAEKWLFAKMAKLPEAMGFDVPEWVYDGIVDALVADRRFINFGPQSNMNCLTWNGVLLTRVRE